MPPDMLKRVLKPRQFASRPLMAFTGGKQDIKHYNSPNSNRLRPLSEALCTKAGILQSVEDAAQAVRLGHITQSTQQNPRREDLWVEW